MYSQNTINRFIELRAEDKTLQQITNALKISIGLAHKWAHEHEDEIAELAFARKEAVRERYLGSFENKLSDVARELQAIDAELKERDFQDVSTEFLLYRKTCLQSRLDKTSALSLPKRQPPASLPELKKTEEN